jgi:hypothetical protein
MQNPMPKPSQNPPPINMKILLRTLTVNLCAIYQKRVTEPMIEGYWNALSDLSEREASLAFREATKRCKFLPTPAEIREALNVALERMPRRGSSADAKCEHCDGNGWEVVEHDGRKFAITCRCIKKQKAS